MRFLIILAIVVALSGGKKTFTAHSHGETREAIAVHEDGHIASVRYVKGKVRKAVVTDHYGYVEADYSNDPHSQLVVYLAGQTAAGEETGLLDCSDDNRNIKRVLKQIPSNQRSRALSDARYNASHAVNKYASNSNIRRLIEKGQL